jgi:hypothetical protein
MFARHGSRITRSPWLHAASLVGALVAFGCGSPAADATRSEDPIAQSADELRVVVGRHAAAYDYAHRSELITAAAGDTDVVFVAEPVARRVVALDRVTGVELGDVPAPPDGWLLPFALRVPANGKLVVLDPGGLPSPNGPIVPRLYDIDFRVRHHRLETTLERTVSFANLPLIFSEDVEVLPSGSYVVAESFIGALWLVAPDGTITPGLFPGAAPIGPLAPCPWPQTTVDGIPFGLAGGFVSGVVALAARGPDLYFAPTCRGGVFRIPLATLADPSRSPEDKAADIVAVSPKAASTPVETLHGLTFNRFDARDHYLYAADPLNLRLLRIDPATGSRETLLADRVLFNFPVKPQFVPPLADGITPLLVPSDQEHRFSVINAAIDHDMFQPPWIVTKVVTY